MTDNTTLELPEPVGPAPAEAPRRRRRWIGWIVAAVVLVVLLVVGYIVAESAARSYATGLIRDELGAALSLDADQPMAIDLGGGSLLLQAAGGSIDRVTVDVDDVAFGDVTGDLSLAATGISIDGETPADSLTGSATIDADNVQKLRSYISAIDLDAITLGDGVVDVSTTVPVLVFTLPVSASIAPSVDNGDLLFSPVSVTVNGAEFSLAELREGPFGDIADRVVASQSFCVAEYLPASIVLTGVDVTPERLRLDVTGDDVVIGPQLSTMGTCD
jgi:hypothetical protein